MSCGWGISNIGFVMICFGVCNGIASICSGSIVKMTGRSPVICFALSLHVALIVTLLVWRPTPDSKLMFFLISGLWGICDALWLVQINCKFILSYYIKIVMTYTYRFEDLSQTNIPPTGPLMSSKANIIFDHFCSLKPIIDETVRNGNFFCQRRLFRKS